MDKVSHIDTLINLNKLFLILQMSFLEVLKSTVHERDIRNIELEFRVGFQTSTGFVSNIPKIAWINAKNKLSCGEDMVIVDKYIKSRPDGSARHVTSSSGKYMEYKQKIANDVDITGKFAIRSSLAIEIREENATPPNSFVMQRTKYRTSFKKGPWSIDFTRVEIIPIKNDIEEVYEIEVELLDTGYMFERELHMILAEGIQLAQSIVIA